MKVTITQLKESIREMVKQELEWDVIDLSLSILENQISESEFIGFCEEIEALV